MVTTVPRAETNAGSTLSQDAQFKFGRSFQGWSKKRRRQLAEDTKTGVPERQDKKLDVQESGFVETEISVGKDTRWAVLWLRRLRPRKKGKTNPTGLHDGWDHPKVMTLAEQLREAQDSQLSLPESKVTPFGSQTYG